MTYTEFWAPYQDLITKVETARNHPLYGQFSSHTDLYDTVLLALGQDVAKQSLEPMLARTARKLAASRSTDIWDEIAPALDWIFHNGPPPAPLPTLDKPLPTSINLSTTIAPTHLTLTDYFGHETDADLTFTVTLDNPIATISQWDELISIKNTRQGDGHDDRHRQRRREQHQRHRQCRSPPATRARACRPMAPSASPRRRRSSTTATYPPIRAVRMVRPMDSSPLSGWRKAQRTG